MSGWFKLHRELKDKPIWKCATHEQRSILMTILMSVQYEPIKWFFNGDVYDLQPGQMITTLRQLSDDADVSVSCTRNALKKLEKMGFCAQLTTNKNTLIILTNWASYQSNDKPQTQLTTNEETNEETNDRNTNKEIKNIRNKEIKKRDVTPLAQPTLRGTRLKKDWEPNDFLREWATNERPDLKLNSTIDAFRDYWCSVAGQKGLKLDWDATFKNWVRRESAPRGQPYGPVAPVRKFTETREVSF